MTKQYNLIELLTCNVVMGVVVLCCVVGFCLLSYKHNNVPIKTIETIQPTIQSIDYKVYIDMDKIAMIESSNNPKAYNKYSKAVGLYQITPICLADYNQYHNIKYNTNDLYDERVNTDVAYWYMNVRIPQLLKHYKQKDTVNNRLIAYNAGIKYVIKGLKLPTETINYISKYNIDTI